MSLNRTAATFEQAKLVTFDFDGTTHATFEKQPELGIVGVDEAYREAIPQAFYFDSMALDRYMAQGEHSNRTPTQIVRALAPHVDTDTLNKITCDLVAAKLAILIPQIGRTLQNGAIWPQPIEGFLEAWQKISEARAAGQLLDTAIISAGHSSFIRKVFNLHGIEPADIMVTDETIRGLGSSLSAEQTAKPNPFPMMCVQAEWLKMYGVDLPANDLISARITHVGDSLEKDGKLAENCRVGFVHITQESPRENYRSLRIRLGLGGAMLVGAMSDE